MRIDILPMSHSSISPEDSISPVFSKARRQQSGVRQRNSAWIPILAIAGAIALGLVVFVSLTNLRAAPEQIAAEPPPPPAPPEPISPPPPPPVVAPPTPAPLPVIREIAEISPPSWRAPAVVVDLSEANVPGLVASEAIDPSVGAAAPASDDRLSANEFFASRLSSVGVNSAQATKLANLALTAPQGTMIPAVLETAINSDLPGSVRAVVSRDVRGFDGSTVLVPRGSKLMGEYRSGVSLGQSRAFVIWSRILTPDGTSIDIGSPSTDRLGRGGLEGETDTHFFQRFGGAILMSVMSGGLNALAQRSNNTAVIIGSPQIADQVAGITLQNQIDIPVTITVPQGTPLQVFVTRDLDFSSTQSVTP
jgi:type IV secretory pathway VirB10-like protein